MHATPACALETITASFVAVPVERVFDGLIEAIHKATVSSQVAGHITEINYDVDDFVPKGAVILQFRGSEQKARSSQAEAVLRETRARRQEAEDEYQRIKDVYDRELVSKAELDRAEAALKSARARLDSAEAALDEARVQAGYTVVRAPYSGYVTERHVETGESVTIGQPLMTGVSLEELRATVSIPQSYLNTVRDHASAVVILPDGSRLQSSSMRVFPFANEQSHTFDVRIKLPQTEQRLYPGMFVKVALVTGEAKRLLVPKQSIVYRSELTAVYVVKPDGGISFRQVRTGWSNAESVEILAGMDEGELVALDPIAAGIQLKQQR